MKKLLGFFANILYIGTVIWDIAEFLFLPALLVLIGLINSYSWKYYAIAIGGYFLFFAVLEIVTAVIARILGKTFVPFIKRKIDRIVKRSGLGKDGLRRD